MSESAALPAIALAFLKGVTCSRIFGGYTVHAEFLFILTCFAAYGLIVEALLLVELLLSYCEQKRTA
jgi:hypothetical protein